jgi:hypothetical protein
MTEPGEIPENTQPEPFEATMTRIAFHRKKLALQSKVGYIQRDKQNPHFKYKYVSAEAVLKAVNPAMLEARMSSMPTFRIVPVPGGRADVVTVECVLHLTDEETGYGEIASVAFGSGQDTGDKAVMKAQTAALKYAWTTALNVPTGDDPEADANTDKAAEPEAPQPTKTYTPTRQGSSTANPPAPSQAPVPQAAQPALLPPAASATPAPAGKTLSKTIGKIVDFKVQNGYYTSPKKKGEMWERYDITLDDNLKYSTFDKVDGDKASMLAAGDGKVVVYWLLSPDGKYRNLESIDAA